MSPATSIRTPPRARRCRRPCCRRGLWRDVALELVERGRVAGIFHAMAEPDVERILRHPTTMIASDGEVPLFGQGSPHPRSYGTFVRVLGRYVREKKVL